MVVIGIQFNEFIEGLYTILVDFLPCRDLLGLCCPLGNLFKAFASFRAMRTIGMRPQKLLVTLFSIFFERLQPVVIIRRGQHALNLFADVGREITFRLVAQFVERDDSIFDIFDQIRCRILFDVVDDGLFAGHSALGSRIPLHRLLGNTSLRGF